MSQNEINKQSKTCKLYIKSSTEIAKLEFSIVFVLRI